MKSKAQKATFLILVSIFFVTFVSLFIPRLNLIVWRAISVCELKTLKLFSNIFSKPYDKTTEIKPNLASHRGVFSETIIENSPKSIVLASQKSFRYIELDVSFSKDFVPFIFHDSNLKFKTNFDKPTSETFWVEIEKLKLLDGQKIMRLRDFLSEYGDLFEGVIFDIKTENRNSSKKASSFCNAIDNSNASVQIYIIGRPCNLLTKIKRLNPEFKIGCENQGVFYNYITGKDLISLNYSYQFSYLEYQLAQKLDLEIVLWTINNPQKLYELRYLNNAVILTDLERPLY
jgi:glycerophosphoryl diester phosphodiesterase